MSRVDAYATGSQCVMLAWLIDTC